VWIRTVDFILSVYDHIPTEIPAIAFALTVDVHQRGLTETTSDNEQPSKYRVFGQGCALSDQADVCSFQYDHMIVWTWKRDIEAFASILFEIVVGQPRRSESSIPPDIPSFVSEIIEKNSVQNLMEVSVHNLKGNIHSMIFLKILKTNEFRILDDVDSTEVSTLVNWVESAE
jgi:hypothetical protein